MARTGSRTLIRDDLRKNSVLPSFVYNYKVFVNRRLEKGTVNPSPLLTEVRNRGCLADFRSQLADTLRDFGEGMQAFVWHGWLAGWLGCRLWQSKGQGLFLVLHLENKLFIP